MKKRGVLLFIALIVLVGLVALSMIYGREIFADVTNTSPYTVFDKPVFDYVLSDTRPTNDEIINTGDKLSTFSAQGETEPITFSVRANQDLGTANITISDLVFGDSTISKDNIEIYNIKLWDQCSVITPPGLKIWERDCRYDAKRIINTMPELLVKDNEQDLVVEEPGWDFTENKYIPPDINSDFNVDLKQGMTYTFFLRIKTPEEIIAGKYSGKVSFSPTLVDGRDIDLELEVLPFSLPADSKDRLIYFNQRTSGWGDFNIGRALYEKYIDAIKDAGFNGLVVYQNDNTEKRWTIDLLARKNFTGPIVFINCNPTIIDYASSKGLDAYCYGVDEPNWQPKLSDHLNATQRIHNAGDKVMTAIRTQCIEASDDPEFYLYGTTGNPPATQKTDLPNYAFQTGTFDCVEELAEHQGKERLTFEQYTDGLWNNTIEKRRDKELYYQQSWVGGEHYNRVVFGLVTHRLGLDGSAPYAMMGHYTNAWNAYQQKNLISHGRKFYDDFDGPVREHNTVYPGADGPVLTLQWEALREGIDDSRYVTLLEQKIAEEEKIDPTQAAEMRQELRSILEPYSFKGMDGVNAWSPKISDSITQDARKKIVDLIRIRYFIQGQSVSLTKGYNGFSNPQNNQFAISGLLDKGVVPVQFNRDGQGKWEVLSANDKMTFTQNIGYYLYNKKDAQNLSLTSDTPSTTVSLYKGWNLLSNSSDTAKKLSDLSYTYADKQTALSELITSRVADDTYYLIKNPMGKTVEEAFDKIKTNRSNPGNSSIPAGKMFWFYIY